MRSNAGLCNEQTNQSLCLTQMKSTQQKQVTHTKLNELSILKLYEHHVTLERSAPLLSPESQELVQAELEQCRNLRSEKIDRLYYAWAHHEDAVERAKKEQDLLMAARKHHESQVNNIKGLISWLRRSAPLDSNRILGKDYEFVLSKKKDLTVEISTSVEEWDEQDQIQFCLKQTTTTTKEVVVTSMEGEMVEQTIKPVTKIEIIPNVDKLCRAYQEGTRIPQGVKIHQDYNIKRNRIVHTKGMVDLSSEYSEEFLPELDTTD
jgi:hypothetical protein